MIKRLMWRISVIHGCTFPQNKVMTRTLDHSVPQMLALCREIREDEIRNHPERSSVLRVMGIEWEKDMFDVMKPVPLRKCDAFLLCSDGFWELITEEKMCEYLKNSDSADEWLGMMTKEVRKTEKAERWITIPPLRSVTYRRERCIIADF